MGLFSVNPVPMSFYRDLTAIVPALQTFHEIKDLVPSTNYAILVRAFTGVGAGQYSETVIGGTEEDGTFIQMCSVSCMYVFAKRDIIYNMVEIHVVHYTVLML